MATYFFKYDKIKIEVINTKLLNDNIIIDIILNDLQTQTINLVSKFYQCQHIFNIVG